MYVLIVYSTALEKFLWSQGWSRAMYITNKSTSLKKWMKLELGLNRQKKSWCTKLRGFEHHSIKISIFILPQRLQQKITPFLCTVSKHKKTSSNYGMYSWMFTNLEFNTFSLIHEKRNSKILHVLKWWGSAIGSISMCTDLISGSLKPALWTTTSCKSASIFIVSK